MDRDFSCKIYSKFCQHLLSLGYRPATIAEWMIQEKEEKTAIFRHDVDRKPGNAIRTAEIEREHGIRATYYFRMVPGVFRPEIIRRVAALGHEIGYHYETLSQSGGNSDAAIRLFQSNLRKLRKIAPIRTISMHGSPFSPHDNRDLWKTYDFGDFGIVGEAYLSLDYTRIAYFTDTGRIWNNSRFNIRDRVAGPPLPEFRSTAEMLRYVEKARPETICILTHPNRWSGSLPEWTFNLLSDWAVNGAKWGIRRIRTPR